jgi:hypothetical protein
MKRSHRPKEPHRHCALASDGAAIYLAIILLVMASGIANAGTTR